MDSLDEVLTGLLGEHKIKFGYVDAHGKSRKEVVLLPYAIFCWPEIPLALIAVVFVIWVVAKVSGK